MLTQVGAHEQGSYGWTALMLASRKGMPGIVEKLLAAGAKVETTDQVKKLEILKCVWPRARWFACWKQLRLTGV